jgi:ketosteroid isomerase-like protein
LDEVSLVGEAVDRFRAADDAAFVACFHEDVCICSEPHLSSEPLARGRGELRAWCERLRRHWGQIWVEVTAIEQVGDGVVADALVIADDHPDAGGWHLALAIRFADGTIVEVRPFWQRESALMELLKKEYLRQDRPD